MELLILHKNIQLQTCSIFFIFLILSLFHLKVKVSCQYFSVSSHQSRWCHQHLNSWLHFPKLWPTFIDNVNDDRLSLIMSMMTDFIQYLRFYYLGDAGKNQIHDLHIFSYSTVNRGTVLHTQYGSPKGGWRYRGKVITYVTYKVRWRENVMR